jgi:hypothetical protein
MRLAARRASRVGPRAAAAKAEIAFKRCQIEATRAEAEIVRSSALDSSRDSQSKEYIIELEADHGCTQTEQTRSEARDSRNQVFEMRARYFRASSWSWRLSYLASLMILNQKKMYFVAIWSVNTTKMNWKNSLTASEP